MRFVAISDTHGKHQEIQLPPGDVLIHAGDISARGKEQEVKSFLDWFSALPYTYKIFIAGNHDFFLEKKSEQEIKKIIPPGIIYLNDSGINIEGINVWGSPVTPWFYDWAFNRHRGHPIKKHWSMIPDETNILVTHGPAYGILDTTISGESVGCEDLLYYIRRRERNNTEENKNPFTHICGHIHEAYGQHHVKGIHYINACVLDAQYMHNNAPVIFER